MEEALKHTYNLVRDSYVEDNGVVQPRPAPRFMDTEPVMPTMWQPDSHREAILQDIGIDEAEARLLSNNPADASKQDSPVHLQRIV